MKKENVGTIAALLLTVLAFDSGESPLLAASCPVPSSYASLQSALGDAGCTEVVLAAGTFVASLIEIERGVKIQGVSSADTVIEGGLRVRDAALSVSLEGLTIDATAPSVAGCVGAALDVTGAQVSTRDVIARSTGDWSAPGSPGVSCLLFTDGFESGDTSRWQ